MSDSSTNAVNVVPQQTGLISSVGSSFRQANTFYRQPSIQRALPSIAAAIVAIIGIIIAVIVVVIIIGGIKRIANVTEKVVPFMALMYLIACLYIIVINFALVDDAISLIISGF